MQTSSERRAECPERQAYRTACECFHALDDRLKKPALGDTSSQPNDEPRFAAHAASQ